MVFLILAISAVLFYMISRRYRTHKITDKKVLVIGGSSGLGLAFAKILRGRQNNVTVTSRNADKLESLKKYGFTTRVMDVDQLGTRTESPTDYDYVFCCPGVSYPSYFTNQSVDVFERTMRTNYLGTVGALKHYSVVNKRPFRFVMIGSTLSLFTFPGFSSYSPSKAALLSFFYTVYDEMQRIGISLHFYNTASITTPGYRRENTTKPPYTRSIEDMSAPACAEDRAHEFLDNMMRRRVVPSDIATYMYQIRTDCERVVDYVLFPLAVAFVCISKVYARWKFWRT